MKLNFKTLNLIVASAIFLNACTPDSEIKTGNNGSNYPANYSAYIVNEGAFGNGNGDISIYNIEDKALDTNAFMLSNDVHAGDAVQSLSFYNDKAFIVAGASNRMEVVNAENFNSIATINGLSIPRYMAIKGNKGYLTEWVSFGGDGRVSIIDLENNTKIKDFIVSSFPEKPFIHGDNLWIPNSDTNIVSVYNTVTESMTDLFVNHGPKSFVLDQNNTLWVLCSGKSSYAPGGPTTGSLVGFPNAEPSLTNITVIPFASTVSNPSHLNINKAGDQLYYLFGGICKTGIDASTANTTAEYPGYFHGLSIDLESDDIYAFDAADFSNPGNAFIIQPNGTIDSLTAVGVIPNGAVFK